MVKAREDSMLSRPLAVSKHAALATRESASFDTLLRSYSGCFPEAAGALPPHLKML
jgi:hypothetical protein